MKQEKVFQEAFRWYASTHSQSDIQVGRYCLMSGLNLISIYDDAETAMQRGKDLRLPELSTRQLTQADVDLARNIKLKPPKDTF